MGIAAGTAAAARGARGLPEGLKKKYELAFTAMLLVSTVLIALCVYQSQLWSGIQAQSYQEAAILRAQSNTQNNLGNRALIRDTTMVVAWIEAMGQNQTELANEIAERFLPRLQPAFRAWLNMSTPGNPIPPGLPMDLPEYVLVPFIEAERLSNESDVKFQQAQYANQVSDNYVLATVLLASVLFLAGVHQRWEMGRRNAAAVFTATIGIFAVAMVIFLYLPKTFGF